MTQAEFVQHFGDVFEATPRVAQRAWRLRPFKNMADLHEKMVTVVTHQMPPTDQLALIRRHPELGARVEMAAASGLTLLRPDQLDPMATTCIG